MQLTLRVVPSPFRSIALATAGSAVIVVVTLGIVASLWRPGNIESFLPAQSTLAVFRGVQNTDLEAFLTDFPELKNVPMLVERADIAIVQNGANRIWIVAPAAGSTVVLQNTNLIIGRNRFVTSDPSVEVLLKTPAPVLRDDAAYHALMRPSAGTSFYVTSPSPLPDSLNILLGMTGARPSSPVAVHKTEKGVTLSVLRTADAPHLSASPAVSPALSGRADVSVHAADLQTLLDAYLSYNAPEDRTRSEAKIKAVLAAVSFGSLSWSYDVLPLLRNETTLTLRMRGDAAPEFLFEFTAKDTRAVQTLLARLHESVSGTTRGITERKMVFEDGLSATVVTMDPSAVGDENLNRDGWKMRLTGERGGALGVGSAQRGQSFLVGNSRNWLMERTGSGTLADTVSVPGASIVNGMVHRSRIETGSPASPVWTSMQAASGTGDMVHFALRDEGTVLHLSLESR